MKRISAGFSFEAKSAIVFSITAAAAVAVAFFVAGFFFVIGFFFISVKTMLFRSV